MIGRKPARWAEAEQYIMGLRSSWPAKDRWDSSRSLPGVPDNARRPASGERPDLGGSRARSKGYAVAPSAWRRRPHDPRQQNVLWSSRVFLQFNGTVCSTKAKASRASACSRRPGRPPRCIYTSAMKAYRRRARGHTGYLESLGAIDARRRHLAVHQPPDLEVTDLERSFVTRVIRRGTSSGNPRRSARTVGRLRRVRCDQCPLSARGQRHRPRARRLRPLRRSLSGSTELHASRRRSRLVAQRPTTRSRKLDCAEERR